MNKTIILSTRKEKIIMEYSKTKLPFVSGRKYNNLLKDEDLGADDGDTN